MIVVDGLCVTAGAFRLRDVSFQAMRRQYVAVMGKTGSGKTTLLETICGLRPVDAGTIALQGRDVTNLRPGERGIGYVPQDGALFPTKTVYEHLAFALRLRKTPAELIGQRVAELAELLGIGPLLYRRPAGLSGGEAQRVALGRALAAEPALLCLDEPLRNLDRGTHRQMCELLKAISGRSGITTLHVTHDIEEARLLAGRVLYMENGRVRETTVEGMG